MYASDHQQIIDGVLKAFALAEAASIPVMLCYDGYLLSHTYMPFEVPEEEKVPQFLKPFKPSYALDPANPANLNTVTLPDVRMDVTGEMAHGYMEIRYLLQEDLRGAISLAQKIEDDFAAVFGRGGNALLEPYRCDDAEYVVVGMGSLTYQLRDVVETLRAEGHKIGVLGVRLYRPFPDQAVAEALRHARGVFVIEKALSYGYEGALISDLKSALYTHLVDGGRNGADGQLPSGVPENGGVRFGRLPFVRGLIAGIGGRDIRTVDLTDTLRAGVAGAPDERPDWIGIKL
jgi:pyruvate ferredoxin oxidoreductase alpha subunit